MSPELREAVETLTTRLRWLDREELYILDERGRVLRHAVGDTLSVANDDRVAAVGKTALHNHPCGNAPFSPNDYLAACSEGTSREIVVTRRYRYTWEKERNPFGIRGGWLAYGEAQRLYDAVMDDWDRQGGVYESDEFVPHAIRLNERVAALMGWEFRVESLDQLALPFDLPLFAEAA